MRSKLRKLASPLIHVPPSVLSATDPPRTLVDQAARAILAATARGEVLPDDRLVEADIARALGISRVPVREALRLLESQGVVVSIPYKGMRLMSVTNRGVGEIMRVRATLEALALQETEARGGPDAESLEEAHAAVARYAAAMTGTDGAELVAADEAFHAALCHMADNTVLCAIWTGVARQLSVVWALGHATRPHARTLAEHRRILETIEAGQYAEAAETLRDHLGWHAEIDFEGAITRRRAAREAHAPGR